MSFSSIQDVFTLTQAAADASRCCLLFINNDKTRWQVVLKRTVALDAQQTGDSLAITLNVTKGNDEVTKFLRKFCANLGLLLDAEPVASSRQCNWRIVSYQPLPSWLKLTLIVHERGTYLAQDDTLFKLPKAYRQPGPKPRATVSFHDSPGVLARLNALETRLPNGSPNP